MTTPHLHIIYAHPYPSKSTATRAMLEILQRHDGATVHSLYERYSDFDIDIAAEQAALSHAQHIVWLAPVYWYSVPGLLKHWFDVVLASGWAFGAGGTALHGKSCWWIATTGGNDAAYQPSGMHRRPFDDFVAPIEQTARYCGMLWQPPMILHAVHAYSDAEMLEAQAKLAHRLEQMLSPSKDAV